MSQVAIPIAMDLKQYIEEQLVQCQGSKMGKRHFDEDVVKTLVSIAQGIINKIPLDDTPNLFISTYKAFVELKQEEAEFTILIQEYVDVEADIKTEGVNAESIDYVVVDIDDDNIHNIDDDYVIIDIVKPSTKNKRLKTKINKNYFFEKN